MVTTFFSLAIHAQTFSIGLASGGCEGQGAHDLLFKRYTADFGVQDHYSLADSRNHFGLETSSQPMALMLFRKFNFSTSQVSINKSKLTKLFFGKHPQTCSFKGYFTVRTISRRWFSFLNISLATRTRRSWTFSYNTSLVAGNFGSFRISTEKHSFKSGIGTHRIK